MIDDRTSYLDFYGKKYPLCLTVLASEEITKLYGSFDGLSEKINGGFDYLGDWAQLLHILMGGGEARVKAIAWMNGTEAETPEVPSLDAIRNILSWNDVMKDKDTIMAAVFGSAKPTVEAEPDPKNGAATQESE